MTFRIWLACSVMMVLVLVSCEQMTAPDDTRLTEQDLAALKEMILTDPLYTNEPFTLNDGDGTLPNFGILGKTATPIIPISWGRTVTSVDRDITFDRVNDTTLIATLTHTLVGNVRIVAKYSVQDTGRTIVRKPFKEVTIRKIKFGPAPGSTSRSDTSRRGWKPSATSAVKGGTQSSQVTITEMEITVGTQKIVITDPTNYFMDLNRGKGKPWLLTPGNRQSMKVRITLTSADPDTDWVSIHRPFLMMMGRPDFFKPAHERMKLISQTQTGSNYQRVYEATWENKLIGRHTFFVSALTRSSLHDDVATFSSQIWGLPYISQ